MSRFKPLGNFIYENGDRIGCTVEEANVEIAQKLNAYQMRIERLKAEVDNLRKNADINPAQSPQEIERLKAEIAELKNQPDPLTAYLYAAELAKDDIKRLKAEVERLRKAGDLLAFHYISLGRKLFPTDPLPSSIDAWNAAKEGKPNA